MLAAALFCPCASSRAKGVTFGSVLCCVSVCAHQSLASVSVSLSLSLSSSHCVCVCSSKSSPNPPFNPHPSAQRYSRVTSHLSTSSLPLPLLLLPPLPLQSLPRQLHPLLPLPTLQQLQMPRPTRQTLLRQRRHARRMLFFKLCRFERRGTLAGFDDAGAELFAVGVAVFLEGEKKKMLVFWGGFLGGRGNCLRFCGWRFGFFELALSHCFLW